VSGRNSGKYQSVRNPRRNSGNSPYSRKG